MPPPIPVQLHPHDAGWAAMAAEEAARLHGLLGPALITVHHIGSTAIPGILAKPIIDLLPVVTSLAELDAGIPALLAVGYESWGELGLPGRRYFTRADPAMGHRLFQLHGYAEGSAEITRHLAFRDHLRAHPELARAYEAEKIRCRDLHPADSHAYGDCKAAWVQAVEAEALNPHA